MADMAPESWSQAEIVRALQRIEGGVTEVRQELRSQRSEFVPREVWDETWRGLTEWKASVSASVADLEAEAARHRRDVDDRFDKERADRTNSIRWGIGIGVTAAGVVTAVLNAMGLGA